MNDLTGQIFGCLKVLGLDEEETKRRSEKYGKPTLFWKTECRVCHKKISKGVSEFRNIEKTNLAGCSCRGIDLTGEKIGRLTVTGIAEIKKTGKRLWRCECSCGNVVIHETGILRAKSAPQSCGCLQREAASQTGKRTIHYLLEGREMMSPQNKRIHTIWTQMRQRCNNPNNHAYSYYGGRGIKVCKEWEDVDVFEKWALENGYEDTLTIDRIDSNGNYEPSNCRWTTMQVQANNTRGNKYITYKGETKSLADWCRELNLDYSRTKVRLNACHYTPEQAFELDKYAAQYQFGNKALGQKEFQKQVV